MTPIRHNFTIYLFNLIEDPGERNDVLQKYPDITGNLMIEFKNWFETDLNTFEI